MTTPITSFAGLEDLKQRLATVPSVTAKVATRGAAKLTDLAQASFDAGQGVYGQGFGPGNDGKALDLRETDRLRNEATKYVAIGTKIRTSVAAVPYARFHIKRGILPRAGELPVAWRAELKTIADDELAKHFEVRP